jgi:hypothetical protein
MINFYRSISFTTQLLQDNEDEQSTQYYVIDEPRPTAMYPDFFSTDFPHANLTFLNKYNFQMRSHNVMEFFLRMVKTFIKFIFIYCVCYFTYFCHTIITVFIEEQKTSTLPEKKSQYAGWLFQKDQNFSLYDFRGKKRTPASSPSIRE